MDAHTGGTRLTHGNNSAGAGVPVGRRRFAAILSAMKARTSPSALGTHGCPCRPTEPQRRPDSIVLSQAIGSLLPSAIGVALSPVPIIAVILMLGTPKARSNGTVFALGWVAGLVAVSVIVLIVAGGASNPNSDTATGVNWLDVFLGVLFVAMAARQWRGRPKRGEEATMPKWMASIDGFGAGKSAASGSPPFGRESEESRPDAGGRGQHRSGRTERRTKRDRGSRVRGDRIAFRGRSGSLLFARRPRRAAAPLATIKEFMSDHNAVIMMVILLVLGLKLLGAGIGGLGR